MPPATILQFYCGDVLLVEEMRTYGETPCSLSYNHSLLYIDENIIPE